MNDRKRKIGRTDGGRETLKWKERMKAGTNWGLSDCGMVAFGTLAFRTVG